MIYAILLLSVINVYHLLRKITISIKGETTRINTKIYVTIVAFMLSFIAGFRSLSVGIDTFDYANTFNRIRLLDFAQIFEGVKVEHGYVLFQYLVGQIFGEFQALLIIVAVLYIGVVSYYIYKYSKIPVMSYILFIGFGFFTFGMSGIRQTIAISFVLIAFKYIKTRNLFGFLLCVTIASLFHVTALISIPSYWFNKLKFNNKTLLIFIGAALLAIGFKDEIRAILNSFARNELSKIETGGNRMLFLMVVSTLLGVAFRNPFLAQDEDNKYFFYMMAASTIIMPITQFNPVVMRLYYYYFIFVIIYIPNLMSVIEDRRIQFIGVSGYALTAIIWFLSTSIFTEHLQTYLFFWQ